METNECVVTRANSLALFKLKKKRYHCDLTGVHCFVLFFSDVETKIYNLCISYKVGLYFKPSMCRLA